MLLSGKITEIITSRAVVSFGGYVTFERNDTEYKMLEKVFVYLSNEHQFYGNHVVLKISFYSDTYYIGHNDGHISIGNTYHRTEKEDDRDNIPVNYRLTRLISQLNKGK